MHSKVLYEGQIRPVAVAAFEDVLFLTRTAKWKVAYHEGLPFSREEQLPYCKSRVQTLHVRSIAYHLQSLASTSRLSVTRSTRPSTRSGTRMTRGPPPSARRRVFSPT
jgi:hypothetical protein